MHVEISSARAPPRLAFRSGYSTSLEAGNEAASPAAPARSWLFPGKFPPKTLNPNRWFRPRAREAVDSRGGGAIKGGSSACRAAADDHTSPPIAVRDLPPSVSFISEIFVPRLLHLLARARAAASGRGGHGEDDFWGESCPPRSPERIGSSLGE